MTVQKTVMDVSFYLKHKESNISNISKNLISTTRKPRGKKPKTTTPIYAYICYEGYKMKFYFNESAPPEFWDKTEQRVMRTKKFPEYPELNQRIDNIAVAIKKIARNYANDNGNKFPTPDVLRGLLSSAIRNEKPKDAMTFFKFFDIYIEHSKTGLRLTDNDTPITPGTIKTYETTKACLEKYQAHSKNKILFDKIDLAFYLDFRQYCMQELTLSTNYIGKHIKCLKSVLRYAEKMKVVVNQDYKTDDFKAIKEKVDNIYLTETELKALLKLDLSDNMQHDRVRDLFIIGCWTGLRFGDLSRLRPDNINGGMIAITPQKTGDAVVIPVHSTVKEIMSKYGGNFPPAISDQKTNAALKVIAKKVDALKKDISVTTATKGGKKTIETLPKYKMIVTHTARRSFCTNMFLQGVPTLSIMAISGHKTESAFMKYIKVTPDEHAKVTKAILDKRAKIKPKTVAI